MIALGKIVVVKHIDTGIKSAFIQIPDSAKNSVATTNVTGIITHIGSKSRHRGMLGVGDKVIVPYQFGTRKTIDGKDLVIYDDEDILAFLG